MLLDIVSPLHSTQAFKLIKQREKMRKIIETKHKVDYENLMNRYDKINPAKMVKENFKRKKGVGLYEDFDTFKNWSFNLTTAEDDSMQEVA